MPTIADAIAQLSPPQSRGDELAIGLLTSYQRQLAELETKIAAASGSSSRSYLADERRCLLFTAESVAAVALAYRGGN